MSPLRAALRDYLRIRRSLGFKLESDERLLEDFIGFLEQASVTWITTEQALRWAKLPRNARPYQWRKRLGVVRLFARYLATIDPSTPGGPGGSHPGAPTEPCLTVSRYTALLIQSVRTRSSTPSGRTDLVDVAPGLSTIAGPF